MPKQHYTVSKNLDLSSKEKLEGDMITLSSRLRNTEQFWKIQRNDLNCMLNAY